MFDFAALPPEINSARMYSGPGSASMLSAASAWNTMASEMRSTATHYGSVITELTGEGWLGPSSLSMLAAAVPYVQWLSNTATQAEQVGAQANAAATAFESAFAMTVPPTVVAANRARLLSLIATNVFGQNTPAIAATEAQYAEMWAQDTAAMHGYASASSAAAQLTPFTAPPSETSAGGVANQANAVAQVAQTPAGTAQSIVSSAGFGGPGGLIAWLESLLATGSDPSSPFYGLAQFLNGATGSSIWSFFNSNWISTGVVNGAIAGGPFNPQFILGTVAQIIPQLNAGQAAVGEAAVTTVGDVSGPAASSEPAGLGSVSSAGMGQARLVGAVSVPPSWTSAATISPAETALPANGLSDIGSSPAGGPGGVAAPMDGTGGRRRRAIPKYGFRPVVMPRPPAAG